jgi:acetoin utilization protein AcuB
MTPFPFSIEEDESLTAALTLMAEHKVRHLPVTGPDGCIVGLLSERDINLALSLAVNKEVQPNVAAACTPSPYCVDLNEDIRTVLEEIVERRIGSAVVTKNGKLAGIFTTVDACRSMRDLLDERYGDSPTDLDAA